MKKKLLILVPLLLLLSAGGAYEMVLKPKPKKVVPKIDGSLVALGDPFTVNLAGGHYGRISVSVLLSKAPPAAAAGATTGVVLPENDAVRAIVTDDLTGVDSNRLIDRGERHALVAKILEDLKKSTDEPVTKVLFTDVAVQ
ncbi:MAG TPA: flagellar basal body-associated FliL family protein [Gaiellaceae bacterium]|jgi:flagellar basal body-associated protein FliL